jgi:2-polyprenyl-3-methyl-5-hydroxy-6-metoxy-1,4-benzoquinol methylase
VDEYTKLNRDLWDELAPIHAASDFYNVADFKAGGIHLRQYEVEELGDVTGKDLLHLMCHIGVDTLSWARLGARVTGTDLSDESIRTARALAEEVGIEARFITSDVYDLPAHLEEEFDVVYMSRGVIGWLPHLDRWGRVVAHFLRPGGTFYISEIHPLAQVFDDKEGTTDLTLGYPYFSHREPLVQFTKGSYADRDADLKHVMTFTWAHDLGDIVTSLASAGLRIDFLHEFPFSEWEKPFLIRAEDGTWRLPPEQSGEIPLSFSLAATKPRK